PEPNYTKTIATPSETPHFSKKKNRDNSIYLEFEVFPQYEVNIDGKPFRVDIAIFLKRRVDKDTFDTRRIAIECDGYDFHSSPIQKKNDDIRSRKLKLNGWKEIFRYSGSEISNLNENEFQLIF